MNNKETVAEPYLPPKSSLGDDLPKVRELGNTYSSTSGNSSILGNNMYLGNNLSVIESKGSVNSSAIEGESSYRSN